MEFAPFREKMEAAGLGPLAVEAFRRHVAHLGSGAGALVPESSIAPIGGLPGLGGLPAHEAAPDLVGRTVIIKLNGGLGTGMGLEKAKSLLPVKAGFTFLDLIARQVLGLRKHSLPPRVLFMNSFSTSADTLAALATYPGLGDPAELELLQNRVPKIDPARAAPADHPADPDHEWCPPGHGDLYVALAESGQLDALLATGLRYAFVSNSDNLGATLDLRILHHVATSGTPFLMEVTRRTASDRKGGHLCTDRSTGRLVLRESAQCPEADSGAFQDIDRHRYFNTNNLWVDLAALRRALDEHDGILPLPVIHNRKTVDPRDPASTPVLQLETAMGAAIGCFDGATALEVPRSRFAPVKSTSDLLALRSDAYDLTPDFLVVLAASRQGVPPEIELDPAHYKLVDGLDLLAGGSTPSLIRCRRLAVRGPWRFTGPSSVAGEVTFSNPGAETADIAPRDYADEVVLAGP